MLTTGCTEGNFPKSLPIFGSPGDPVNLDGNQTDSVHIYECFIGTLEFQVSAMMRFLILDMRGARSKFHEAHVLAIPSSNGMRST